MSFVAKMYVQVTRKMALIHILIVASAFYLGYTMDISMYPIALISSAIMLLTVYSISEIIYMENALNKAHAWHMEQHQDEDEDENENENEDEDTELVENQVLDDEEVVEEDVVEEDVEDEDVEDVEDVEDEDEDVEDEDEDESHTLPALNTENEHYCAEESCGAKLTDDLAAGLCAGCNLVYYCNSDCQKKDWKAGHKLVCGAKLDPNIEEEPEEASPQSSGTLEAINETPVTESTFVETVDISANILPVVNVTSFIPPPPPLPLPPPPPPPPSFTRDTEVIV